MNIILIIVLLIVDVVCWVFGTSLVINNETSPLVFKLKSVFYWLAIVLTFCIGFYIGK